MARSLSESLDFGSELEWVLARGRDILDRCHASAEIECAHRQSVNIGFQSLAIATAGDSVMQDPDCFGGASFNLLGFMNTHF
jgi:hypothetical protein